MCSNAQARFDCLEEYMDELLGRFEDFAKKSLVLISVALGSVLIMAIYILKQLTDTNAPGRNLRTGNTDAAASRRSREPSPKASKSSRSRPKKKTLSSSTQANTVSDTCPLESRCTEEGITGRSSAEEKIITEIGLASCSEACNQSEQNVTHSASDSKILERKKSCSKSTSTCSKSSSCKPQPCTKPLYLQISATPSCRPKHHLSESRPCLRYIAVRTSCCSMCCFEDDRR